MFTTFANRGVLVLLLLCLGAVSSFGAALIYALWCTDKKQRELRQLSNQFPDATLMGDYRVRSGMRFENGRYVLSQRVTSDALREVFYKLKEF